MSQSAELEDSFKTLGFGEAELKQVYDVVAGIMHLLTVNFIPMDTQYAPDPICRVLRGCTELRASQLG